MFSACRGEEKGANGPAPAGEWISEESNFESVGFSQAFKVEKKLFSEQTPYQKLEVYSTSNWGNLMVLDGVFQNTESDEFAYHEMQAHVPLFAHPNPRRVLIIGGGDGGVAREVLKHESVEKVVLVDIDKRVTDVSRQFFPKIAEALDNPKLEVHHEDGAKFVENPALTNSFDVVCIDSSDPIGPNEVLFREPFYRRVAELLTQDGIAICQGECMWLHPMTIRKVMERCRTIFPKVHYYWHLIPVYPCGTIGMVIMGKNADLDFTKCSRLQDAEKICGQDVDAKIRTRYYNPAIHQQAFVKPNFWTADGPTTTLAKPAEL